MSNRSYTREEIILLLEGVVGKTLGEVDKNNIFERTKRSPKITGIAGDVIEQSVIGYSADSRQEPDILIDNVEVEIKTTGLRKTRSNSESATSIVAKEPMTITAVSPEKIIYEKFDNSNLWHKLKNMLLVYYLYDSEVTVPASEYAEFPILGYQFLKFSEQDKKIIENDWKIVRNYIRGLATNLDNPKDGYAGISKLRENMLYMDTAPKYPNPPRFRLRRKVVSGIAQKHFGTKLLTLDKNSQFYSFEELHNLLSRFTKVYKDNTVEEIGNKLGIQLRNEKGDIDKQVNERILAGVFGVRNEKLRNIDVFTKLSILPKTLTLTSKGGRTEDTKFETIDFKEWTDESINFENSSIYDFFSNQTILFSIFKEPYDNAPLEKNIFRGFKRLTFSDDFIEEHVKKTWDNVRNLLFSGNFKVNYVLNKKGERILNKKTKTFREETNFPKSRNNIIFLRGTGRDSNDKTVKLNNYYIYRQQYWIKGSKLISLLQDIPYL